MAPVIAEAGTLAADCADLGHRRRSVAIPLAPGEAPRIGWAQSPALSDGRSAFDPREERSSSRGLPSLRPHLLEDVGHLERRPDGVGAAAGTRLGLLERVDREDAERDRHPRLQPRQLQA